MYQAGLHRFAILVAACTLFLVVAGASVVSKEAGLSVPDWPLSYGRIMPEMTGGVFFEHGHRMVATAVGFLTIVLAVWLQRADPRAWMKKLGWAALGAVVAQGMLGGLTVLFLLPKPVSITHACLAQLFFSTTVALAVFTSRGWLEAPVMVEDSGRPSLRTLAVISAVAVFLQVTVGAAFRHKALNLAPHLIGAFLAAGLVLYTAMAVFTQFGRHRALQVWAHAAIWVTLTQVVLGAVAFMSRVATKDEVTPATYMVVLTVAHVATGALTLASSIMLAMAVFRNVRPENAVAAVAHGGAR